MISLSPLMNDLPKEAFLLPPANFSERLIQAGIRPELHDRLLGLASQIQALQAEVNTSLNSCLSHLRKRIASYNKLLENQDARVSSLESRLAKSRTDLLTLYAAASLVDRIRITSSPRVLFSQMLADFGEATAPLVTFFSSHWRGDPDVARAAVDCTGQFLLGDGSEPVERSTEVTDWLTASTALGYQIPQHLEPLAYVTVCTRMSNAMPVDLLHIDFKPILALQELESLWLSNPSGREQEEVQTLLRYAAIQLRFPGFARYLGSLDFQRNLVGIVNSNVSNDLREVAVFALSHYGSEEYSGVQLKPASIQALIKAASTKEDPITQIYNIRAIPDAYIEDLIKKLSAGGRAGSSAIKQLSPLVSLLEKSDSRDVRLEITKKLFPALLQNSSKHDFIREPILRALGRVSDRRYLAEQMEDLLLAIDSMFEWTKSPENVAASLTTDNKLSPETLNCYALLDFLFTHESSSDKAVARGASFLLKHIFG
jgi:hypothetical protein